MIRIIILFLLCTIFISLLPNLLKKKEHFLSDADCGGLNPRTLMNNRVYGDYYCFGPNRSCQDCCGPNAKKTCWGEENGVPKELTKEICCQPLTPSEKDGYPWPAGEEYAAELANRNEQNWLDRQKMHTIKYKDDQTNLQIANLMYNSYWQYKMDGPSVLPAGWPFGPDNMGFTDEQLNDNDLIDSVFMSLKASNFDFAKNLEIDDVKDVLTKCCGKQVVEEKYGKPYVNVYKPEKGCASDNHVNMLCFNSDKTCKDCCQGDGLLKSGPHSGKFCWKVWDGSPHSCCAKDTVSQTVLDEYDRLYPPPPPFGTLTDEFKKLGYTQSMMYKFDEGPDQTPEAKALGCFTPEFTSYDCCKDGEIKVKGKNVSCWDKWKKRDKCCK